MSDIDERRFAVAVTGGRNYQEQDHVLRVLSELSPYTVRLVLGDCKTGVDCYALSYAEMMHMPFTVYHADWKKHGKSAGPRRNTAMIVVGKPDLLLAFPGGAGTLDCTRQAAKHKVPVVFSPATPTLTDIMNELGFDMKRYYK